MGFSIVTALLLSLRSPVPLSTAALILVAISLVVATNRLNFIALSLFPIFFYIFQHSDRRKVLRNFSIAITSGFFAVFFANKLLGFNSEYTLYFWRDALGTFIYRESLGFIHPNQAMMAWSVVILSLIGYQRFMPRLWQLIVLAPTSVYFFQATESRSASYVLVFTFLFAFVSFRKIAVRSSEFEVFIVRYLPTISLLASLTLPLLAQNTQINNLLTGRPAIAAVFLNQKNAISFLGNIDVENSVFDNGYLHTLIAKGVIFETIFLVLLFVIFSNPKHISKASFTVLFFYITYSLGETALLNCSLIFVSALMLAEDRHQWGSIHTKQDLSKIAPDSKLTKLGFER